MTALRISMTFRIFRIWRRSSRSFSGGEVSLLSVVNPMRQYKMTTTMGGLFPRIHGSKGTYGMRLVPTILLIVRAIHRNPKDFPDPDRFYPDRYLKENRLPYPNEKGYNTFGWGRRGMFC